MVPSCYWLVKHFINKFIIPSGRMLRMEGVLLNAILLLLITYGTHFTSAEEVSFDLSYKGGKILTEPVTVSILWFGTGFSESDLEVLRNAITSLSSSLYLSMDSDVPTLGDWWDIVRQYTDSSNSPVTDTLEVGAECFYTGPQIDVTLLQVTSVSQLVFNKSLISEFSRNLTCNRAFEVNESSIYFILFSHEVLFLMEQTELSGSCKGKFQVEALSGVNVSMAWVRAPQTARDQCSTMFSGSSYVGSPNGDERIDAMVGFMLGMIAEEVTNPDGSGWSSQDFNGFTVSSTCDLQVTDTQRRPPLFKDAWKNVSFNAIGLNGYKYILRYIWDQQTRICALKPSKICDTNLIVLKQFKGHLREGISVNHTDGLQPYPPNQRCKWSIHYPGAKFISFTFNYFFLAATSNDNDMILLCDSMSKSAQCTKFQGNSGSSWSYSPKNYKVLGSKAFILFTSGTGNLGSFGSRGWELTYSAGLCNGQEDIFHRHGTIGYMPPSRLSLSYVRGLNCLWVLHGKIGTLVSINFSHINMSKSLDFLAIYNGTRHQISNFSGYYTGSDLPQLNLTGKVIIAFDTQTDEGDGWSAKFYIASPVDQNRQVLLVGFAVLSAVVAVGISLALVAFALCGRKSKLKRTSVHKRLMLLRLETFRKENQIGEGTSAIVYRADLTDGKLVAVKCRKDATSQTRLEEEILFSSSSHPNIISLVGYIQDGLQRRYLVFEYMVGGSLSMKLRERGEALDWEKRLAIALQICSAIQKLHMYTKPPVYHGNIASENIFLDESCNAKLGGFGSANYCSKIRTNPEELPEMSEDIWGFGIVLVELLRGEPLKDRQSYRNFTNFDEINELVGGLDYLDARLGTLRENCKIVALEKLGDIAKWCIGCSISVGGSKCNPRIGDLFSGLKQVKQMFSD